MLKFEEFINKFINKSKTLKYKIEVPDEIKELNSIFIKENSKIYIVGGAVRDALKNLIPKDYDLVTELQPDKIIKILDKYKIKYLIKDIKFGIIIVQLKEDNYELASARIDVGKGRRPDSVEFTNLKTDANRRDLTINALYYDIEKELVIDYVNGIDDIYNNNVRAVGNAEERLTDDKLRKMRVIRFSAQTNSNVDKDIDLFLKKNNSLEGISNERIKDEFVKIIKKSKDVNYAINLLEKYNFFKYIFMDLKYIILYFKKNYHYLVIIASLLRNNSEEALLKYLNVLKYTNDEIKIIIFLIKFYKNNVNDIINLYKYKTDNKIDDNFIIEFSNANILDKEFLRKFLIYKPDNNYTLGIIKQLGIKPSREMGAKVLEIEIERFNNL